MLPVMICCLAPMANQAPDPASARKEISAAYDTWDKGRIANDPVSLGKILASDFTTMAGDKKLNKEQTIALVTAKTPNFTLKNIWTQVMTVTQEKDKWTAVVSEKLEGDAKGPGGKPIKLYLLAVYRDIWSLTGEQALLATSETVGTELWRDTAPPIRNWNI